MFVIPPDLKNTPIDKYSALVDSGRLMPDFAQKEAIARLNELYLDLTRVSWNQKLKDLIRDLPIPIAAKGKNSVRGLYLCGGVGRGKTMLMDLFYSCLPPGTGQRYHFHRFMQRVHDELTSRRGNKNPLKDIAAQFAREAKVICFDEFYVSDIADAMILGELLKGLFDREMVLIATSNSEPKKLYPNGLQRAKFLPAIELLSKNTDLLVLLSDQDFRLRALSNANIYYTPVGEDSRKLMLDSFRSLSDREMKVGQEISVLGRSIRTVRESSDLVWFDFSELCEGARSQNDFIEISKIYQTVFLSGVPILDQGYDSAARRFISLVDEFYDRGVKLIIEADALPGNLYEGEQLIFEFLRTESRLMEMQSLEYLSKEHH